VDARGGINNFDTEQLPFSPAPVTLMVDVFTGPTPRTSGATMNPLCEEFEAPRNAAGTNRRARFGHIRQLCRESVVIGTKGRLRKHSRLSSRINRSTRLRFTTQPSRRSCAATRR